MTYGWGIGNLFLPVSPKCREARSHRRVVCRQRFAHNAAPPSIATHGAGLLPLRQDWALRDSQLDLSPRLRSDIGFLRRRRLGAAARAWAGSAAGSPRRRSATAFATESQHVAPVAVAMKQRRHRDSRSAPSNGASQRAVASEISSVPSIMHVCQRRDRERLGSVNLSRRGGTGRSRRPAHRAT